MHHFSRLAIVALALAPAAAPAAERMGAAKPAAIAAAARSCVDSITATSVDETRLAAGGWKEGKLVAKGKKVDAPLRFFGRGNDNVMLISSTQTETPLCLLTARIEKVSAYKDVAAAVGAELGGQVLQEKANESTWVMPGRFVQLAATGTRDKPAVRISVGYLPPRQ